jgi:ADP-heptose:LPS heptosyltransferase
MKVLVIRLSAMGDVALCVPVIARAIELNPDVAFTILTKTRFRELYDALSKCDILSVDFDDQYKGISGLLRLASHIRKLKFDQVIDLHDVTRSRILRYLINCPVSVFDKARKQKKEYLELKANPVVHTLYRYSNAFLQAQLKMDHEFKIPVFHHSVEKENAIGFAPFAAHITKSLQPEQVEQILISIEKNTDKIVYLFGSQGQFDFLRIRSSRIIDTTSWALQEQLQRMSGLERMIAVDSVNMHLAALQGISLVSIWGATHPDLGFGPLPTADHHSIISDLNCHPCSVYGEKECHYSDTHACIKYVNYEKLSQQIQ